MRVPPPVPATLHDDRPLKSLPGAAAFLGLGLRTLKTLISAGVIPVCRISARRVAIRPSDLDAYVLSRRS